MVNYVLIRPINSLLTVSAQRHYINEIKSANGGHQFTQAILKGKSTLGSLPHPNLDILWDLGLGTWIQR